MNYQQKLECCLGLMQAMNRNGLNFSRSTWAKIDELQAQMHREWEHPPQFEGAERSVTRGSEQVCRRISCQCIESNPVHSDKSLKHYHPFESGEQVCKWCGEPKSKHGVLPHKEAGKPLGIDSVVYVCQKPMHLSSLRLFEPAEPATPAAEPPRCAVIACGQKEDGHGMGLGQSPHDFVPSSPSPAQEPQVRNGMTLVREVLEAIPETAICSTVPHMARVAVETIADLRRQLAEVKMKRVEALLESNDLQVRAEAAEARLAAAEKALKESQDAQEAEGQAWIAMTSAAALPSAEEIARVTDQTAKSLRALADKLWPADKDSSTRLHENARTLERVLALLTPKIISTTKIVHQEDIGKGGTKKIIDRSEFDKP